MGTSTARRGPSTAVWRLAKGAATRYLSPEGGAPVEARELVRRYVAALEETHTSQGRDLVGGFRLTRKAAQCLGEFGARVAESGLSAALAAWDLAGVAQSSPAAAVPALAEAWLEDDGGLEAAVARSALTTCLHTMLTPDPGNNFKLDGPSLVKAFFALVFYQRLVLDLGESLEAAAPGFPAFQAGLERLAAEFRAEAADISEAPPPAGQWPGLAGWVYVTKILGQFCQGLKRAHPGQ